MIFSKYLLYVTLLVKSVTGTDVSMYGPGDIPCVTDYDCPIYRGYEELVTCSRGRCLLWEIDVSCPEPPYVDKDEWIWVKGRSECHPSVMQRSWYWTYCPDAYILTEYETGCPKK